jgi:uncharacterized protein YdeI (YjbR/CyaY-like superfamily)
MEITFNLLIDKYLVDGCMRCKYGGTPQCKVLNWREELETLRQIVLECGLTEELKWGVPVYTHQGKNILNVVALKEYCAMGFYKGVLLSDPQKILVQQGNMQSDRLIKFMAVSDIDPLKAALKAYIQEAIAIEESGQKVIFHKNPEPIPEELLTAFDDDPVFKSAFYALTPGRQRGYIIHFSQPKQAQTRISRIEKNKARIFEGIGLNDR